MWFNGFMTPYSQYDELLNKVVSAGFITVSYTVSGLESVENELKTRVDPLIRWIADGDIDTALSENVSANVSAIFSSGHSRGGKVASLAFTSHPDDVLAAVLVDPVDESAFSPISQSNPSAVAALRESGKAVSVIGAGITGSCNPTEGNYEKFYAAGSGGSWKLVIEQAGHAQFVPGGGRLQDVVCGAGSESRSDVADIVSADMVSWFSLDAATKDAFVEEASQRPGVTFEVKTETKDRRMAAAPDGGAQEGMTGSARPQNAAAPDGGGAEEGRMSGSERPQNAGAHAGAFAIFSIAFCFF